MMKKTIKVKSEQRTQLVEFLVAKRVKYFEYLKDIHGDEGGLWMNTLYFNRAYLGRYFGVASDCLAPPSSAAAGGGGGAEGETAGIVRVALDKTSELDATESAATEDAYTYVSLDKLPNPAATARESSVNDWQRRHLPCFVAFACALSELLLVPMSGEEFLESVYHLLLEVQAAFASGLAAKTLAQRNLKSLRQHMSPELSAALKARGALAAAESGASDRDDATPESPTPGLWNQSAAGGAANTSSAEQSKFIFLQSHHLAYTATAPSYDAVMPALFTTLIFVYRRLCDYDLTGREDCVKRILSIDKHVERLLLGRLGKELGKAARLKLVREAYVLSARGLFSEVCGDEADTDFINDIVVAQLNAPARGGAARAAAAGEGDEDVSSSDADEVDVS